MNVIVKGSPLKPPLLDTHEAGTVLVYDSVGQLIYFLLVLPSGKGQAAFLTSDVNDPQFASIALNAGLKLQK